MKHYMKKNNLLELKDELDELSGKKRPQDELLSGIGASVLELVKRHNLDKTREERTDFDSKIARIKDDLTKTLGLISSRLEAFQKSVAEDTSFEESLATVSEEIESLHETIEELRESIDEAFEVSDKRQDEYGVSLMSLSERLTAISNTISSDFLARFAEVKKSHLLYDESLKSLHGGHKVHLERFDIVDKHFLQLEKDLKKYASQIYEYGSSFSILNNGSLIGTSNALNLKAGSNMTITVTANAQGVITAQFDASGGGSGFTKLTPTGLVNGVNAVFVFSQAPTYVISDGVWYQELDSNGVANWTGTTTITMAIPPTSAIWGFV